MENKLVMIINDNIITLDKNVKNYLYNDTTCVSFIFDNKCDIINIQKEKDGEITSEYTLHNNNIKIIIARYHIVYIGNMIDTNLRRFGITANGFPCISIFD